MKKLLMCLLAFCITVSCVIPASASLDDKTTAAYLLYGRGLFKGTGELPDKEPIFELDRAPTRNEAIVMLIRLLGKENDALRGSWETPFLNLDSWAAPYIGYAYQNNLTKGISNTEFGGRENISATQYITFVLRALGYDSNKDFTWDKACELSDSLGITSGQYQNNPSFTRGDIALISENSLYANIKGSNQTLLSFLKNQGIFDSIIVEQVDARASYKNYFAIKKDGKYYYPNDVFGSFMLDKKGYIYLGTNQDCQRVLCHYAEWDVSIKDDTQLDGSIKANGSKSHNYDDGYFTVSTMPLEDVIVGVLPKKRTITTVRVKNRFEYSFIQTQDAGVEYLPKELQATIQESHSMNASFLLYKIGLPVPRVYYENDIQRIVLDFDKPLM